MADQSEVVQMLRERERALAEAQRLAGLGSWEWDAATDTVSWSEGLFRLAERDPSGPAVSYSDHPHLFRPESWARLQSAVEEALDRGRPYELDLEMVLPTGRTRWVLARGEALHDAEGRVAKLRGTVQDITERRNAEQALSTLGRRLIESQEAERARVARELHDDVGQRLALLSVALDRYFKSGIGSYDDLHNQLAGVQDVIKGLSHELHATPLRHLSVATAVRGYCEEVALVHDVQVSVRASGDVDGLGPDVSLCLFRVVQEALRNALRHSGSREFDVELSGEADAVSLEVRDRGVGFDYAAAVASSGLGVVSMQERLKVVHGELTIDTGLGHGTRVRARVPRATAGQSGRPEGLGAA